MTQAGEGHARCCSHGMALGFYSRNEKGLPKGFKRESDKRALWFVKVSLASE